MKTAEGRLAVACEAYIAVVELEISCCFCSTVVFSVVLSLGISDRVCEREEESMWQGKENWLGGRPAVFKVLHLSASACHAHATSDSTDDAAAPGQELRHETSAKLRAHDLCQE